MTRFAPKAPGSTEPLPPFTGVIRTVILAGLKLPNPW
jgi:hypothetical protein